MNDKAGTLELEENKKEKKGKVAWIKKIGFAGFMFFLIKGLIWVAVFVITLLWGPDAIDSIKAFFTGLF